MNWLPYRGGHCPDLGMGHFHVPIDVSHRAGGRVVTLKALVVAADPVRGRLVPVPGRLKRARAFARGASS